jgi:hypothetical protein
MARANVLSITVVDSLAGTSQRGAGQQDDATCWLDEPPEPMSSSAEWVQSFLSQSLFFYHLPHRMSLQGLAQSLLPPP